MAIENNGNYGMSNKEPKMIFVLGTGRSGSTTISHLLSSFSGVEISHELVPVLNEEVVAYLTGYFSEKQMIELLRITRNPARFGRCNYCGESNQRLSFLIEPLSKAFPDAFFLWLIRDGRDAVASMDSLAWYHQREIEIRPPDVRGWVAGRIDPKMTKDEPYIGCWDGMTRFGKCCWYWKETNLHIKRELERLNLRYEKIQLEKLSTDLRPVLAQIGIDVPQEISVPVHNLRSKGSKRKGWRMWSSRERLQFTEICGELMDSEYPGWSEEMALTFSETIKNFGYKLNFISHDIRSRVGAWRNGTKYISRF